MTLRATAFDYERNGGEIESEDECVHPDFCLLKNNRLLYMHSHVQQDNMVKDWKPVQILCSNEDEHKDSTEPCQLSEREEGYLGQNQPTSSLLAKQNDSKDAEPSRLNREDDPALSDFASPVQRPAESQPTEEKENASKESNFAPGDHVYQWRKFLGIPFAFQHHGVVMDVKYVKGEQGAVEETLTILDYTKQPGSGFLTSAPASTGTSTSYQGSTSSVSSCCDIKKCENTSQQDRGTARVITTEAKGWHKVVYSDSVISAIWKRSGTYTVVASDPPDVVMKRVNFLLGRKEDGTMEGDPVELPNFNEVFSNCECLAVWCKTGVWSTMQAASFCVQSSVSGVPQTASLVGTVAGSKVIVASTVPAKGLLGWFGATTTTTTAVPLVSIHPWIIPAMIGFGAVNIGGPLAFLLIAKAKWNSTTTLLNQAFEGEMGASQENEI
ncbi:unknown protein [Seminavis robusta]|uniref:Uncharacterized protein n=1 Tax=Seminavis robusta TaxID=568900 RepID=A0A9N8EAP3_9STRA|nr:unknown protein [Seminavis robusta]|eukprot:Sro893_g217080.1 n/a (440) ;mRNA; f:39829-41148